MSGYHYRGTQRLDPDPVLPKIGPRGGRPCGTEAGAKRHREAHEQPCDACRRALAQAKARRRGGNVATVTGQPRALRCGTYAGAVSHRKRKEPTCFACKVAEAAAERIAA
jgi:hypothetical protein